MSEPARVVVDSPINKNNLLYGVMTDEVVPKNFGPSCVDMQGEKMDVEIKKSE